MKLKYIIPSLLFIFTVILIFLFKHNSTIVESVYSNSFYPIIAVILSFISGILPFSISDIFYLLLIIWIIGGLVFVLIKKRRFKWYLTNLLLGIAYIISAFYILWGFNYYRANIYERINIVSIKGNKKDVYKQSIKQLIKEASENYLPPTFVYNALTINESIESAYSEYSVFLGIPYPCGKRRIKPISLSSFFAKSGILGYFGPFFNEVHVNSKLTKWDVPIVTAHEKAHQFGITSEGEANFYAWIVCSNSNYKWNRYSAAIYALSMFLYQANNYEEIDELLKLIPMNIINDIRSRQKYWAEVQNKYLDAVSNKINDVYLKSNNIDDGVKNYDTMVELIMAYKQSATHVK